MSDKHDERPDDLPDSVTGLNAESDVVAERSGAGTPHTGRPVPADPPEAQAGSEAGSGAGSGAEGGDTDGEAAADGGADRGGETGEEPEVRPDAGPTG
ncbi:hypothetical protein GCM10010149_78170 [Nonomuraea roseoviolacea subsp. roseoviolacea]|uniref:Uncharacterized protein n=1 Tax=Nonomuraea roseoviolacea subsp. carminata TaxID=160689 RepID=A0ABT1K943_9ACTN|nr:hypothetical protein [Nonomuraea roseoviolacea]MCP2350525.1 hypothetical protein [Nonomuraea roseoviolacea subsp. carminata]